MSGHSKWANIKHRKQAVDAKKGKVFNRIAKEIIIAAKLGGADEENNPRLKSAILKARQANMPKDNIYRNVKKGSGEAGSENYEELTYEGYGPGGVAFVIEVMTDKKSRTIPEIKNIFSKAGGSLAESGAVSYQFDHRGVIILEGENISEESLLEEVIEAGAQDLEKEEDFFVVTTSKETFHDVMTRLSAFSENSENKEWKITESGLKYIPNTLVKPKDEQRASLKKLVDQFEEHDDVQNVYTNLD